MEISAVFSEEKKNIFRYFKFFDFHNNFGNQTGPYLLVYKDVKQLLQKLITFSLRKLLDQRNLKHTKNSISEGENKAKVVFILNII